MTIQNLSYNVYSGLSSDTKPTNVVSHSTFIETDTNSTFTFTGSIWSAIDVSPITISYSSLNTLASGNNLVVGQKYFVNSDWIVEAITTSIFKPLDEVNAISVSITGLTTIDLTNYKHVGTIYLTSSNATETIDSIILTHTYPVILRPAIGLTITFNATSTPLASANQIALFSITYSCNGTKAEHLKVQKRSGYFGVYQIY